MSGLAKKIEAVMDAHIYATSYTYSEYTSGTEIHGTDDAAPAVISAMFDWLVERTILKSGSKSPLLTKLREEALTE